MRALILIPAAFLSLSAQAQTAADSTSNSQSSSRAQSGVVYNNVTAVAASLNGGNNGVATSSVSSDARVRNSGTQRILSAPGVVAPALSAAGLETCLGSASLGISVPGAGATFGTSTVDKGCDARLDARTLVAFGLKDAAIARLCMKEEVAIAMPQVCAAAFTVTRAVPVAQVVYRPLTATYASQEYAYTQPPPPPRGCVHYELFGGCKDK